MRREVGALNDELRPLQMRYSQERERLEEMRRLQSKRDQLLINISTAETVSRFQFVQHCHLLQLELVHRHLSPQAKCVSVKTQQVAPQ